MDDNFKPADQHRWLRQMIGDWSVEGRAVPDDPQWRSTGTETVVAFGEAWVVMTGEYRQGDNPETGRSRITLGFDPAKDRFVGDFISSHMPSLWPYEGELDPDGFTLRLRSRGMRMDGQPGESAYEDVIQIVSPDERTLTGRVQDDDGQWTDFMVTTYRRR